MENSYLFVVAHPDDEILGAGATINKLVKSGEKVSVCILSQQCNTRYDEVLINSMHKSHKVVGVENVYVGSFRCLCFKDEPHQQMVEFIEKAIKDCGANKIFTHHPTDLNNDHYIASICCQEAARISMRGICSVPKIMSLFYMEVQSSTDWCFNNSWKSFTPNTFIPVDKQDIKKKIEALEVYDNVIRPLPHPRAKESIEALAICRGTQCGYETAEAFECAFLCEV